MKMHNWIFKNGTILEVALELARLTNLPPERLVEPAAFISAFRPHDIRFAIGNTLWHNGQLSSVDTSEFGSEIEFWMSTEYGDHIIPVAI